MNHKEMYSHREPSDIEAFMAEELDGIDERCNHSWYAVHEITDSDQLNAFCRDRATSLKNIIEHLRYGTMESKDELNSLILKLIKTSHE